MKRFICLRQEEYYDVHVINDTNISAVFVYTAIIKTLSRVALNPSLGPLPGAEWRIRHRIHARWRGNESQVRGSIDV